MRIVAISDTHGYHDHIPELPEADVLIHAGDFMNSGRDSLELIRFAEWLGKVNIPKKLVVAGNHDILFDRTHRWSDSYSANKSVEKLVSISGCDYFEDRKTEINGVKFYFSPWTPAFFNWGFNADENKLRDTWSKIPDGTDVLVTHGPPYGVLDQAAPHKNSDHLGCKILHERVSQVKPKVHIFGHIHGGRGVLTVGNESNQTTFINASFVKENYVPYSGIGYTLIEIKDGKVEVL